MDRKLENLRRERSPKKKARTARERDLMDLIAHGKRRDARVADAIVTVLCRADASTLAALGLVLQFVVRRASRRPR